MGKAPTLIELAEGSVERLLRTEGISSKEDLATVERLFGEAWACELVRMLTGATVSCHDARSQRVARSSVLQVHTDADAGHVRACLMIFLCFARFNV